MLAVTSGKGGVGKTNVSANLGIALAARGARVCVFDADAGMANINVILGQTPRYSLEHLLNGECALADLLLEGPRGLRIVPAASGVAELADLNPKRQQTLLRALAELERDFDYLLIDTAAGAAASVLRFIQSAQVGVMVVTPEPTSLTNAFSLLKIMRNRGIRRPAYVLVNQVGSHRESLEIFGRFRGATRKYLKLDTFYLGYVQRDPALTRAVRLQRPVIQLDHQAPSSRCFYALAEAIDRHLGSGDPALGFSEFWNGLAGMPQPAAADEAPPTPAGAPAEPEESLPAQLARVGEAEADALLAPLLDTYQRRFGHAPLDPRRALFEALERRDYPADEIRYLSLTLEELYEKHHRRPLHDLEHAVARLLAANGSDPGRMEQLVAQLRDGFARRFGKPLLRPEQMLLEAMLNDRVSEAAAEGMLLTLSQAFAARYGRPPGDNHQTAAVHHIDDRAFDRDRSGEG